VKFLSKKWSKSKEKKHLTGAIVYYRESEKRGVRSRLKPIGISSKNLINFKDY